MTASTEVRITDPTTGAQKGQKLERYDLIPFDALDELARVYGVGAKKYADRNWEKGYAWGLSLGALCRHIARFARGEDIDPETDCPHLAHAAWHCLALLTFSKRRLGTDDRAKAGPLAELVHRATVPHVRTDWSEPVAAPKPATMRPVAPAFPAKLDPPDFDPGHPSRGC